ncbi:MAG: hypothetical protein AB1508_01350 [Pseudomonadota bacterium]
MNPDPFARSDLPTPGFEGAAPAIASGKKASRDLAGDWAAIWPESPADGWAFQRRNAYHSSFNQVAAALASDSMRNGVFASAGASAASMAYRGLQVSFLAEIESGRGLDEGRSGCKLDAKDCVQMCRADDDKRHGRCLA